MITKDTSTHHQDETATSTPEAGDWLKERKRELDAAFNRKAHELSTQAQSFLASKMHTYGGAIRSASDDLNRNDAEQVSSIAAAAAEKLSSTAEYLQNTDPRQLVEEGASVVRRTPYLALGASLLLGLAIGKLAKSANDQASSETAPTEA